MSRFLKQMYGQDVKERKREREKERKREREKEKERERWKGTMKVELSKCEDQSKGKTQIGESPIANEKENR